MRVRAVSLFIKVHYYAFSFYGSFMRVPFVSVPNMLDPRHYTAKILSTLAEIPASSQHLTEKRLCFLQSFKTLFFALLLTTLATLH